MDSINQLQAEENHADLTGAGALARMKEMVEASPTCFFCTNAAIGPSRGVRPMSVQEVDDAGSLWFLSSSDSHKNQEIAINPALNLYFKGSEHSDFLNLRGRAEILYDKSRIISLWKFILTTWFTEGVNDPWITMIKFTPEKRYVWDTKHGAAVDGVKILLGAVLGTTTDDSIEGKIRLRD